MLVSKRFLYALCLGIIVTVVLATSVPAVSQGAPQPDLNPPYRVHHHGSTGRYNYLLWIPGAGSTTSCANVFSVDSEHGESLEAVAFHTLLKGVNYQVMVIPEYTGPESLSREGVLVAQGTLAEPGFHTIDLGSPVLLDPGTRYAVILHQSALAKPALATDSAKSEAGESTTSQPGESFILLNGVWTDLHTWHPNTVAVLQAWTRDREPPKMSVSDMEKELEFVLEKLRSDHPIRYR